MPFRFKELEKVIDYVFSGVTLSIELLIDFSPVTKISRDYVNPLRFYVKNSKFLVSFFGSLKFEQRKPN